MNVYLWLFHLRFFVMPSLTGYPCETLQLLDSRLRGNDEIRGLKFMSNVYKNYTTSCYSILFKRLVQIKWDSSEVYCNA